LYQVYERLYLDRWALCQVNVYGLSGCWLGSLSHASANSPGAVRGALGVRDVVDVVVGGVGVVVGMLGTLGTLETNGFAAHIEALNAVGTLGTLETGAVCG